MEKGGSTGDWSRFTSSVAQAITRLSQEDFQRFTKTLQQKQQQEPWKSNPDHVNPAEAVYEIHQACVQLYPELEESKLDVPTTTGQSRQMARS